MRDQGVSFARPRLYNDCLHEMNHDCSCVAVWALRADIIINMNITSVTRER